MLAIRCFVSYTSLKILSIALSKSEVQKVQNRKNPEFWEKVVNNRGGKPHSRLKTELYKMLAILKSAFKWAYDLMTQHFAISVISLPQPSTCSANILV